MLSSRGRRRVTEKVVSTPQRQQNPPIATLMAFGLAVYGNPAACYRCQAVTGLDGARGICGTKPNTSRSHICRRLATSSRENNDVRDLHNPRTTRQTAYVAVNQVVRVINTHGEPAHNGSGRRRQAGYHEYRRRYPPTRSVLIADGWLPANRQHRGSVVEARSDFAPST